MIPIRLCVIICTLKPISMDMLSLRWMGGEARSTIGALLCVTKSSSYRARLSYLPASHDDVCLTILSILVCASLILVAH